MPRLPFSLLTLLPMLLLPSAASPGGVARYTADGKLEFPAGYRDWVFLTSGRGMSYSPAAANAAEPVFDNVFVNRESYAAFQKTGRWPDGTLFALEVRQGTSHGSINKAGAFQSGEPLGVEVHLKDSTRFKTEGGWAFFGFDPAKPEPAAKISDSASCYSCHLEHGAVDRTMVQFYPTLLPTAKRLGTLSEGYLHDEAEAAKQP